jgi:hypothetical protein
VLAIESDDWKSYAHALEDRYALTGTIDSTYRRQRIASLQSSVPMSEIDWTTLAATGQDRESIGQWRPYETA